MKRSYGVSVKRSKNFQAIEIHEGFEDDFTDEKEFDTAKQALTKRVSTDAEALLNELLQQKEEITNHGTTVMATLEPVKKKKFNLEANR